MVLWCSQQIIWVLVYFQALASDSGPRLSGNGGEGRGGAAHGELTRGLFLTLESSSASQSQKDWEVGVGHACPSFSAQSPRGLVGSRDPGILAGKGGVVRGVRGPHRAHAKEAFCPGSVLQALQVRSVTWQNRIFLLASGMPSGARE